MGMPAFAPGPVTTIEALLALPYDGARHELLDGVHVVTPAPYFVHQVALARLYDALHPALTDDRLYLLWSPADIHLGPRTLVQPDLFIMQRPETGLRTAWRDVPTPRLIAEVLSPSTAARDRGAKRRLYLAAGVEEYWIVDIDAQLIERWKQGDEKPEMLDSELQWSLGDGASGTVDITALFDGLEAE